MFLAQFLISGLVNPSMLLVLMRRFAVSLVLVSSAESARLPLLIADATARFSSLSIV